MSQGLQIGTWLWSASAVACVFFAIEVLRSHRVEQSMAAWLLLFLFVPPFGVVLYLWFGRRKLWQRVKQKPPPHLTGPRATDTAPVNVFDCLTRSYSLPPATEDNTVTLCGTGETAYAAVVDLIERAEHCLWIVTYILGGDAVAADLVRRLAERAAAGVQVRLLIDDVGSPDAGDDMLAPLKAAGGAVARFMPTSLLPRSRHYTNLRNHRKIVVADQRRAWSGGMNLSELYLGPTPHAGRFRDLSFVIDGPAAATYASIFTGDWEFAAGERLPLKKPPGRVAKTAAQGVVQVVPSGPEVKGDSVYELILTMVHRAERRLWAVSPYFVPDAALMRAFILAARRGVDVRFVSHCASDLALLDFANIPYLRALATAGGRVLRLKDGMVHAKALVLDDALALAGTVNLDQRSLFLNFEVMALFHGAEEARAIAAWIKELFPHCAEGIPNATPMRQVAEGFVRLFAPVL